MPPTKNPVRTHFAKGSGKQLHTVRGVGVGVGSVAVVLASASASALLLLLLVTQPTAALARTGGDVDPDSGLEFNTYYKSLSFPDGFMIGAGSSAYQIEGGWNASGKGVSVLDRAYNSRPDGGGKVACDSYHRYREDVAMLKLMGASHYRFSLAWSRLLPTGEPDNVNPDGVRYYDALLDELEANGIEPIVTLLHEGAPAVLDSRFGGWLNPLMVDYFEAYAVTAFTHFGNRVRHWITINEPFMFCVFGIGHGRLGASTVSPGRGQYTCGHHMLLAHARAYRAYKERFAASQGGRVGLTLHNFFTRPCSRSPRDVEAAEAHQQFELGWFLEPLLRGGYPPLMRQRVDANSGAGNVSRLPTFDPEEQKLLKGALDFLGLNVYFGLTACQGVPDGAKDPSLDRDAAFILQGVDNQFLPPGPFRSTPWALKASLDWLGRRYGSIPIIITENGLGDDGSEGLHDAARVDYLKAYLSEVLLAVHVDHHNISGYFAWCLLDDYEWGAGYKIKFGLVHIDFESGSLTRTPKDSLFFLKDVIESRWMPVKWPDQSAAASSPSAAATVAVMMLLTLTLPVALVQQRLPAGA